MLYTYSSSPSRSFLITERVRDIRKGEWAVRNKRALAWTLILTFAAAAGATLTGLARERGRLGIEHPREEASRATQNRTGEPAALQVGGPTITVNSTADEEPSVSGDGKCTLREAIVNANLDRDFTQGDCAKGDGDDTITFASGVNGTITLTSALPELSLNLTIQGPGANVLAVKRSAAENTPRFRIFTLSGEAEVAISGLTVSGGYTMEHSEERGEPGGGLFIPGGSVLTLEGVAVDGNATGVGAGEGGPGGGIFNSGTLTIKDSTISRNKTGDGLGSPTFGGAGGGIHNTGALTLENVTISSNATGGGTYSGLGGGLYNEGTVMMTSVTVTNNLATAGRNDGTGGVRQAAGQITVRNSIISNNLATHHGYDDVAGSFTSQGYNLVGVHSGDIASGFDGPGDVQEGASLGPLQNNGGQTETHRPLYNSPALDRGHSFGLTKDQRSDTRPVLIRSRESVRQGDGSDIGAYEEQFQLQLGPALVVNAWGDTSSGTCDESHCTLREAIEAANLMSGDNEIVFAQNIVDSPILLTGQLPDLSTNITIRGPGAQRLAVRRDTGGFYTIFTVRSGATVNISGLTITNGFYSAGGISNGGRLTVTECVVSGNQGASFFQSFAGGGIYNSKSGTLTLLNSTVSGNSSRNWAAGIANEGTMQITNSNIAGNRAAGGPANGAILNDGLLTITGSTISDNVAVFPFSSICGGIGNGGTVTIINSTITGNISSSDVGTAGAIYNFGTVTVASSTITNNKGGGAGGVLNFTGTVQIKNTIIAGNSGETLPDVFGAFTSNGYNLIGKGDGGTGFTNGLKQDQVGSISAPLDPLLGTLQDNGGPTKTYALLAGSPAIDRGSCRATPVNQDQRGEMRPLDLTGTDNADDGCDIGSFELAPPLTITVHDASLVEGAPGELKSMTFTVSLSRPAPAPVSVKYQTSDFTAGAPGDYASAAGELTFPAGASVRAFSVQVAGDATDEFDEFFLVSLSDAAGATIFQGTGFGTITDDDGEPSLSVSDANVTEGNSGTAGALFTVKLSAASGKTVVVNYATADGTANAGSDYNPVSGSLFFQPGTTEQVVSVPVLGDLSVEPNETFTLNLSQAGYATITKGQGTATISNDDDNRAPSAAEDNYAIDEDKTLNVPSPGVLSNDADPDSDALRTVIVTQPTKGTLKLEPDGSFVYTPHANFNGVDLFTYKASDGGLAGNTTSAIITVNAINDAPSFAKGPDQSVSMTAGPQTVAGWATAISPGPADESGQTLGFVITGNTNPALFSTAPTVSSSGTLSYTVADNMVGKAAITLELRDNGGTTGGGQDISPARSFMITVNPVDTSTALSSSSNPSGFGEPVSLKAVVAATHPGAAKPQGTVTFKEGSTTLGTGTLDASGESTLTITSLTAGTHTITAHYAGNSIFNQSSSVALAQTVNKGQTEVTISSSHNPSSLGQNVTFEATVTSPGGIPTGTVQFVVDGTNSGAPVPLNTSGVATFHTSSLTAGTHAITAAYGGDSNFLTSDGTLSGGQAVDTQPSLSVNDISVTEGNNGTTNAVFTVTLSKASVLTVNVDFATADGTATSGTDYQATSGTLSFVPGDLTKTITVVVQGDTQNEPNETFKVNLSNALNAIIGNAQGTGTMLNDDGPGVQFSGNAYSFNEGAGHGDIIVARTGDISQPITVDYQTSDQSGTTPCQTNNTGFASDRCDYATAAGTLSFASGETQKTIQLVLINDAYQEGPEQLTIKLGNPQGAAVGSIDTSTVTVTDDDSHEARQNPIDDLDFFIRQQYIDFLGREPDTVGFQFWKQRMMSACPEGQICDRVDTALRFFRSDEFKERGYFIYLFYHGVLERRPLYNEWIMDVSKLNGLKVVAEQEASKDAFIFEVMSRQEFMNFYNSFQTGEAFVDALIRKSGVTPVSRQTLINNYNSAGRGGTLRAFIETPEVQAAFVDQAFVTMLYYGFLRRDAETGGFDFWMQKLYQTNHDYRSLVGGFLQSDEYRFRFAFLPAS
jgi:CSLREA domain-containing protein